MRAIVAITISLLTVLLPVPEDQRSKKSDLLVDLKFIPQESVRSSSVALPGSFIDHAFDLVVEDSRGIEDPRALGTGTDDDDLPFPIRATTDVLPFVTEAVTRVAAAEGLKKGPKPDRTLRFRLTRFSVQESNKAVGSTYTAEVHLAYLVTDATGVTLVEGAASGSANRYGRARSGANCSEVLSDALKDAFTKTIGDQSVQASWISGRPSAINGVADPPAKESIEQRLKKLDDLLAKGLITKEEHAAARAAILKGS